MVGAFTFAYGVEQNGARSSEPFVTLDAPCDGAQFMRSSSDETTASAAFQVMPSTTGVCAWAGANASDGASSAADEFARDDGLLVFEVVVVCSAISPPGGIGSDFGKTVVVAVPVVCDGMKFDTVDAAANNSAAALNS
jgi:hypothetical protein